MINYYDMNGCDDQKTFSLRIEAVQYFKSLITFRQSSGKPTRLTNFAGHVGRHMRKEVRQWFINQYPNTGDYATFFFEHSDEFSYNPSSGEVKLIDYTNTFEKPTYLTQLEAKACEEDCNLFELSSIMHEFECFHAAFNLLMNRLSHNEHSVSFIDLRENVKQTESDCLVLKAIDNALNDSSVKSNPLVHYLIKHYPTVFMTDKTKANHISLTQTVIQHSVKVTKLMNDTIYVILKPLLIAFLVKNGSKDVLELQSAVSKRHNYIVNCLFANSDDYSMFDFVLSYPKDFTYRRVTNDDDSVSRMIIANIGEQVSKPKPVSNGVVNGSIEPQIQQKSLPAKTCDKCDDIGSNQLMVKESGKPSKSNANRVTTGCMCCVCQFDYELNKNVIMTDKQFREFVYKHEVCLIRKMVKETVDNRKKQLNNRQKTTQTVSTGVVYAHNE